MNANKLTATEIKETLEALLDNSDVDSNGVNALLETNLEEIAEAHPTMHGFELADYLAERANG